MNNKTVLIIEDSNTSLLLMDNTLKLEGYETQLALTVKEAIEFIKKQIPDLIILDLNMPEISGYDFLKMRNELKIENVPIFVISALDSHDSIEQSKALGAAEFIPKPVRLSLVIEKVKKIFD